MDNMSDSDPSPIIGIFLMVIILVIIAAVIGTFIFGLGALVEQEPRASIYHNASSGELKISVMEMTNSDYVIIKGFNNNSTTYQTIEGEQEQVEKGKGLYIKEVSTYLFKFSEKSEGELSVYATFTNDTIEESINRNNIKHGDFVEPSKLGYVSKKLIREIKYSNFNSN